MNRQGNSRKRPRVLSEDEVFSNEDEVILNVDFNH